MFNDWNIQYEFMGFSGTRCKVGLELNVLSGGLTFPPSLTIKDSLQNVSHEIVWIAASLSYSFYLWQLCMPNFSFLIKHLFMVGLELANMISNNTTTTSKLSEDTTEKWGCFHTWPSFEKATQLRNNPPEWLSTVAIVSTHDKVWIPKGR